MDNGISVSGAVRIENLLDLSSTIQSILSSLASDEVKKKALDTVSAVAKVENVSIANCTIDGGKQYKFD